MIARCARAAAESACGRIQGKACREIRAAPLKGGRAAVAAELNIECILHGELASARHLDIKDGEAKFLAHCALTIVGQDLKAVIAA